MSKRKHINLSTDERKKLEELIKTGQQSNRVNARARTLLLLDRSQGQAYKIREVVEMAMVSQGTVANIKRRYFTGGIEQALYDRPRPGAKPKLDGEVEAHLIAMACSAAPEGHAQWTLRLLAERLVELEYVESISHTAVAKKLKKMSLSLGK